MTAHFLKYKIRPYIKRILQPVLSRFQNWYLSKPRWYNYQGVQVKILPSVFHPGYLLSTKILLKYLLQFDLFDKKVLELGAGSGMISLFAARRGAVVTASDINPLAIESIQTSLEKNKLNGSLLLSDLFQNIPIQIFDFVLINPPYYPKAPQNYQEMAFFCGANFEYFKKLFQQMGDYMNEHSKVLMILSEDCDIDKITAIASNHHFELNVVHKTKTLGELNFIFEIRRSYTIREME